MRLSRLLALLVATSLCSCSPPAPSSGRGSAKGGGAAGLLQPEGTAQPPTAPTEFRVLKTSAIPGAVPILRTLSSTTPKVEARRELVEIYRRAGFLGAATFFEQTISVERGEEVRALDVESPIAWSSKSDALSTRSTVVAEQMARLLEDGKIDQALDLAKSDVRSNDPSLQLVVQWADTILWQEAVAPSKVGAEEREAALRIYLTSLKEKAPLPRGIVSRAAGYARLSTVLVVAGDRLSALTASLLGIQRAQEGAGLSDPGPAVKRMLCDQAQALSREVRVTPKGWPESPPYSSVCSRLGN